MQMPVYDLMSYVHHAKRILQRRLYPHHENPHYKFYQTPCDLTKSLKAESFQNYRLDENAIEAIQRELLRLGVLEDEGFFTLLHHEGPFVEHTPKLWQRIDYIISSKSPDEVLTRLKNIHRLTAAQIRQAEGIVRGYAYSDNIQFDLRSHNRPHRRIDDSLFRELRDHLPFCSYNGRDIF